ncbi:amidase family protein [Streptosporangium sp. NPDC048047]|uniref:amidase family protein n=1 Tax=Streptosporangium sp. NPDC048047 TaxID=3155748 RepID=UPI003419D0D5
MTSHLTVTEAAAGIRGGGITSHELTERLLARIEEVDPALNAVVDLWPEESLRAAAEADAALLRGDETGPLHGVPMTVKEGFNVAGRVTTWGNPVFAGFVPDRDATVVERLRAAGAIIVGKTNVPAMLADFGQTANDLYGRTRNPWDTARTPGGSTGGGAAALAAGLGYLEYGSDLVGSIRIPAGFCGVYGLRPTAGTVPTRGFQPPGPSAPPSEAGHLSVLGPLARSAADLRTALRVTAGPEGEAAGAYRWELPPPRHARLADFRVGVVLDHPGAPVTHEVGAVLSDAVDALGVAGVKLREGWPDGIDPDREAETFGFHVGLFFAHHQPGADVAPIGDVVAQEHARMAARAAWTRYFEEIDVFLCPVNFTTAFPHDDRPFAERVIPTAEGGRRYDDQVFWTTHAALPGLPAVAAPAGLSQDGLPVGMQVVGPRFEDDTAITFAGLAADVLGGFTPPPAR